MPAARVSQRSPAKDAGAARGTQPALPRCSPDARALLRRYAENSPETVPPGSKRKKKNNYGASPNEVKNLKIARWGLQDVCHHSQGSNTCTLLSRLSNPGSPLFFPLQPLHAISGLKMKCPLLAYSVSICWPPHASHKHNLNLLLLSTAVQNCREIHEAAFNYGLHGNLESNLNHFANTQDNSHFLWKFFSFSCSLFTPFHLPFPSLLAIQSQPTLSSLEGISRVNGPQPSTPPC